MKEPARDLFEDPPTQVGSKKVYEAKPFCPRGHPDWIPIQGWRGRYRCVACGATGHREKKAEEGVARRVRPYVCKGCGGATDRPSIPGVGRHKDRRCRVCRYEPVTARD